MCEYIRQHATASAFISSESWIILSPIEQSIKRKIEAVGKPLKDWDIQINYGIKTGCNEAFIIDEAKRVEILSNCLSEDERERTEEIIRPILRGKDIKRYSYVDRGKYLINTHNGIKEKGIPPIDILDYPAIKDHLDSFGDVLVRRSDQGDTHYNLRNCAYLEDFSKPKIIFQEMVQESQFYYDSSAEFFCNDTCRIITGEYLPYLLLMLNSHLFFYSVKHFYGGGGLGEHGVRMKHTFFQRFPCLPYDEKIELSIGSNDSQYIEKLLCQKYGLNDEEIQHILND